MWGEHRGVGIRSTLPVQKGEARLKCCECALIMGVENPNSHFIQSFKMSLLDPRTMWSA